MAPHTITPAVVVVCRCEAKELNQDSSLKTTCSIPLQYSFLGHTSTPNGGVDGRASRAAHVMGAAIPNVLQPFAFVWLEKTQEPLVKVLPVPGWRPMKQLALRVHFLRCGGLLDDWSVEGVLSLIFV
ncbi:e3 ubiquitin-protein ligase RNF13 [Trichonephila clavipes]|uniref:E3 ubiquitin-protein ligase RNF13 n=1 Tax=Trichonephila clavipes TaxID=2585209 RepID=A0A8X6V914_TRICX|nr:e3 ubiquitin-protein ligase RNF13 [Trichonephila clavipes]